MLTSLALIFLVGMTLGWVFSRLRLPSLLGMLLTGILLGPYVLNLLDGSILGISADLRQLALIIILTRAGLSLQVDDLKKVGRPAVLMCFLPACFEVAGMLLLAPALLGISLLDAAIMGAVVAAIGSVPLAMGLPCGQLVLTVAVLAILVTAPLGAFGVDMTYRRLLTRQIPEQ